MSSSDEPGVRGGEHPLLPLALAALERYPLAVRRISLLAEYTNTLFRVDTDGDGAWVVRVGISGPVAHSGAVIESEMKWLEALGRGTDLVAPRPLRTLDGELLTSASTALEGPRTCVVYSLLPGRMLAHDLGCDAMQAFGAYAARLHAHGATLPPPPEFSIPTYDSALPYGRPDVLFGDDHGSLMPSGRRDRCAALRDRVESAIRRLADREPPRVIHGDLYPWNALVHRGGIGVLDFEDLLWGWPVQDIAGTFFTLWERDDFPSLRDAFRAGYETFAAWPEADPLEIPTFMAGRSLVLANDVLLQPGWRHEAPSVLAGMDRRIDAVLG